MTDRELDAAIAEKIFNVPRSEIYYVVGGREWITEQLPLYSTDIGEAFEIAERLATRGLRLSLDRWGGDPWWAEFADEGWGHGGQATSTTVAHAICLAALEAIDDIAK